MPSRRLGNETFDRARSVTGKLSSGIAGRAARWRGNDEEPRTRTRLSADRQRTLRARRPDGGRRAVGPPPTMLAGDEPIVGHRRRPRLLGLGPVRPAHQHGAADARGVPRRASARSGAAQPRIEWDACDVVTPDGVRVEVKSSAYLQAWAQARPSSISFGGLNGRTWDRPGLRGRSVVATTPTSTSSPLVTARDHASYDPLDSAQWSFWVLPREVVEATGQKSLALSRVSPSPAPLWHTASWRTWCAWRRDEAGTKGRERG